MVAAIALIAAVIATPPAYTQALYGAIVGTVADQSSAPVPGVTVTATNTGTGHKIDAVTDGDGNYAFRNLQPGTYDLAISMTGFRELKRTGIRATANNPVRQDLKLEVGTVSEAVRSPPRPRSPDGKADLHRLLGQGGHEPSVEPVPQLPGLLNLVPGATPAQLQNAEIDTPGRALSTSINGVARNINAFRVDGAVSVNVCLPHHVGYVQSAETIETVNISTNNFDADQGMAGGAAVNVVTKSGTNQFHGSGFFLRNQDELNANTFSNNADALAKPDQGTSIYGGTIGGPIVHNRLFFFGGWERYAARRGTNVNYSVPSAKMRGGDFSEAAVANPGFVLTRSRRRGRRAAPIPEQHHPLEPDQPDPEDGADVLPAAQRGRPNRNGMRMTTSGADGHQRPRQPDTKLSFQRSASHNIWTSSACCRRTSRQLQPRLRQRGPATRRYTSASSATPDAQPEPRARRQLRHQPPGPVATGPDYARTSA